MWRGAERATLMDAGLILSASGDMRCKNFDRGGSRAKQKRGKAHMKNFQRTGCSTHASFHKVKKITSDHGSFLLSLAFE